jgi:hypothetical protein
MWWLVAGKVLARPHPKAKAPSFYFPKMVGDKIQRRQKSYKRLKGIYSWESSGGPGCIQLMILHSRRPWINPPPLSLSM